jgi:prepilin-type N-terminal cleavage/methylation domain-containing protein
MERCPRGLGGGLPPSPARGGSGGYTLVECLFAITLLAIIAAATAPPLLAGLERSRALSAARFVHGRMMLARSEAASRGAVVALRFGGSPEAAVLTMIVDGNRNGVRAADIAGGLDVESGTSTQLGAVFRGVRIEPVDAAGTLFSFTPLGTSSSGSVYLSGTDGSRLAVRLLGATGRARVLRYMPARETWEDLE